MDETNDNNWAQALETLARDFDYPPTPKAGGRISHRLKGESSPRSPRLRMAVALAAVLAVVAMGLIAVPQTRAAVLEFVYRIGAFRIFVNDPATPPPPTPGPQPTIGPDTPVPLALLAAVAGNEIDLNRVEDLAGFPVLIPPAGGDHGTPDQVLLHPQLGRNMVTFVWLDAVDRKRPRMTFSQIALADIGLKWASSEQVQEVQLREGSGLWIKGPHTLHLSLDRGDPTTRLASNVLLWSTGGVTYRLEGDMDMETAVLFVETLTAK